MKLSKFYSNKPDLFDPIEFVEGLNVVMAEIRLPENQEKDTHNLGKSTLARLIDFCFLSKRDKRFFLFKYPRLFEEFVFFLEVKLGEGSYLTIRRGVSQSSKVSFKKHGDYYQDFSRLPLEEWDHKDVSFSKSKEILDGLLDWRELKPWPYRKQLGYLLRSQEDYREVFQLRKFASKHADWKPYLAHMLGFDADLLSQHYSKEGEIEKKQEEAKTLNGEIVGSGGDISKIEGLLLLKKNEVSRKQALLDDFDFREQDDQKINYLVEEIDEEIADLNARRYSLRKDKKKINASIMGSKVKFDTKEVEKVFEEVSVLFEGQIKKDFNQLVEFNRAISQERKAYLEEELGEINEKLSQVRERLDELGQKRSSALSYLSDTDVFDKYKRFANEVITLSADIKSLERQKSSLQRLQDLRSKIRKLVEEKDALQLKIEKDVDAQNADSESLFSKIRLFFSDIVEEVIDRKALLSVYPNNYGHLEFHAEILDESGSATSADLGFTYRKLLCIAFDLAILRAHMGGKFPMFVYHDGVFESLDNRKKRNLLNVIRRYSKLGLQPIITLIDTDSPQLSEGEEAFDEDEVVLTLHDENQNGRLFKMQAW